MDSRFKDVKVLIWDFDGTLYKAIPELWQEIREAEYKLLMEQLHIDHKEAARRFHEKYQVVYQSATETIAHLCRISTSEAAIGFEKYYDRRKYVRRDRKLIDLFSRLSAFQHFILANGVKEKIVETLKVLGLPITIFNEIVTSEIVGENKPNEKGFRYILDKTGLPPSQHLMIGDRVEVDLLPAKKLGIKTCLVWSKSLIPDISLNTVYDITKILD